MRPFNAVLTAVFTGVGLAFAVSGMAGQAPPLANTVRQIQRLTPAEAAHTAIQLTGTITYYDVVDRIMFLQDETGGIFIDTPGAYPIRTGDRVELTGSTEPSFRTEVAPNPRIRVIGKGRPIHAGQISYLNLAAAKGDSILVRVRGVVRAQDLEQHQYGPSVHLDLLMNGGELQVYLGPSFGLHPPSMLDETVEITGVAGGAFDAKNQMTGAVLFVPGPHSIRTLARPRRPMASLPLTGIDDVFQSWSVHDRSERVRVRGTLTYYRVGEGAVLEHEGKSLFVQTRELDDLAIGDVVDAFGFASDREYAPSLRQAMLVRTGERRKVSPSAVSYDDALNGFYSDNLISLTGVLVSELHSPTSESIVIDVGGHLVTGKLESGRSLPAFAPGSRVRLTGVCRVTAAGPWKAPVTFQLAMRDRSDAQLIGLPSWWTVRHLAGLLAVLLALAVATALWALRLKTKLLKQTKRMERSIRLGRERSRILEQIGSHLQPELLLERICISVEALLPGARCSYSSKQMDCAEAAGETELFSRNLSGGSPEALGWVLVAASTDYVPTPDEAEVYEYLSELATTAVRQSRLHQRLVHHSTHDALTELPNRRLCDLRLTAALDYAALHGEALAVIYIDIDHFKEVNDCFGHRTGDLYLKQISARLLLAKRVTDTLSRIGGDEFLVIAALPGEGSEAESLLERLRLCFREPFLLEDNRILGSASFGLARFPQDGDDGEALKRHADRTMYECKRRSKCAEEDEGAVEESAEQSIEQLVFGDQA